MNENINLIELLENCPRRTKFYSSIFGNIEFNKIDIRNQYPIEFIAKNGSIICSTSTGKFLKEYDGECIIFPSKDQRDWSKFTAPWLKKKRFDPKTLNPFDRVLVRNDKDCAWHINIYSHKNNHDKNYPYNCIMSYFKYCIPYNDDTKHLVGTEEEAPVFYRYWED